MARSKGHLKKKIKMINTWRSYSDMLSGLFILFVLIMLVMMIQAQENYNKVLLERQDKEISQEQYTSALKNQNSIIQDKESQLKSKDELLQDKEVLLNSLRERLSSQDMTLEELQIALEQQAELLDQKEDALYVRTQEMNSNQELVEQIIGLKAEMIKELKLEFDKRNVSVTIDDSGALVLDADVLYAYNDDVLSEEGKEVLYEVLPIYCGVLLSEKNLPNIAEIVIDGYTDNKGSFEYNMNLSQRRSLSVMNYLLEISSKFLSDSEMKALQSKLSANGHSFNDLVYDESGNVDADKSRRVVVKFRLRDEEMINELAKIFSGKEVVETEETKVSSVFSSGEGGSEAVGGD